MSRCYQLWKRPAVSSELSSTLLGMKVSNLLVSSFDGTLSVETASVESAETVVFVLVLL